MKILKLESPRLGGYFDLDKVKAQIRKYEKEIAALDFWQDTSRAKKISKIYQDLKERFLFWENLRQEVGDLLELTKEEVKTKDESLQRDLELKFTELEKKYKEQEFFILFSGPYDKDNAILSIHAGTGGVEAQDWAQMLLRMYLRYCESKDFIAKIIDEVRGQEAGIKNVTLEIKGHYAYGWLKSEAGVHRLVRISPFNAEKMRHTSFALVEIIPELEKVKEVEIKDSDLKIDVFRSSGHGGQSVNTTDSAVRIVHLPTKITVTCQNERSQLQNKQTALKILKSKLFLLKQKEKKKEKERIRGEVLAAEWGNQIRSYVLQPYKMVKDHRTNFEVQDSKAVLDGDLDGFVKNYLRWQSKK